MSLTYPSHIYEAIREQVATSYLKHEFKKLLWRVPQEQWKTIDRDISDWMKCPELSNPRDFWNGFHGICMGFKLKIGLIYFVTGENVAWEKTKISLSELWFGVDLQQTKVVGGGKLPARQVIDFYHDPKNQQIKEEQLAYTLKLSGGTTPRDEYPIIVVQREKEGKLIYSTYDGNRRLAKAVLEGEDAIEAFVGKFTEGTRPKNYWIPTTILMENLLFARQAYEREDKELFQKYMDILKDMLSQSQSAVYELKERALTSQQPFRDNVLKALEFV